jgi:hypothetical protein
VWLPITEDAQSGGAEILSYRLDWDNGTNKLVWTTLIGYEEAYIGTSYTQTGTVPGSIYNFRLSAYNRQGWSPFSPVKPILAA